MFEDEISPEELFNRFFGGAGFGGPFGMSEVSLDIQGFSANLSRRRLRGATVCV